MEQFLLDNAEYYTRLVHTSKLTPVRAKTGADDDTNPYVVIASRLRPLLEDEVSAGLVPGVFPRDGSGGVVDLHELRKRVRGKPTIDSSNYLVDKAYGPQDTTEDVYRDLVCPLVPWSWNGGIGTMFAYGQTGSGKTFTLNGLECLVAESLFSPDLEGTRNIFISIIELSGNAAFDLLNARKSVSILEDSMGLTHLAGASEYHVKEASALLKHINDAASFRRTASTQKNDTSSRSHAICKIRLENPSLPQSDDGLLYLVDLAGSEAARDITAHTTERMKEAREINASLSVLKDCIRGRASLDVGSSVAAKKAYVPFRHSSLTKVLKHVFDPAGKRSCKTVVVACVNPSFTDVGASKNTLRYAEMLRVAVPKTETAEYDAAKPSTWPNDKLREWIDSNSGTPPMSSDILAPHETGRQLIRLPVPEFLKRCLKTPQVTQEQAVAFQAKFWRLHIDSQRSGNIKPKAASSANDAEHPEKIGLSSKETRREFAGLDFKQRIRPGMAVSWNPSDDNIEGYYRLPGRNIVLVLSLEKSREGEGSYRCAAVVPAIMPGAFEVYLWQQVVVPVETMEAEVLLEYDVGTRYYYETL